MTLEKFPQVVVFPALALLLPLHKVALVRLLILRVELDAEAVLQVVLEVASIDAFVEFGIPDLSETIQSICLEGACMQP